MVEAKWGQGIDATYWKRIVSGLVEYLTGKNTPAIIYHGWQKDLPPFDGRLRLVIGRSNDWPIIEGQVRVEGIYHTHWIPGGNYIRISGLPEYPDDDSSVLLVVVKRILEELLPQVVEQDPEKVAAMIAAQKEAERIRSREAYVRECAKRVDKTVRETEKTLAEKQRSVPGLLQAYIRGVREIAGLERKLAQIKASTQGELDKIGEEFDKLASLPKVQRVEVADGVIKVFTETLFCTDDRTGKTHEIGAFRIDVYTNGSNDGVRWTNLSRKLDGMYAPHVDANGKACLGTAATGFCEFLAAQEYALVAMYAINFVESVNTDDQWGRKIDLWPVAGQAPAETVNPAPEPRVRTSRW